MASQWPIPPKHFFDYELKADRGSAGSYYYHSHVGMQALTVTGALIVEDPGLAPYSSDGERLMFLQEVWRRTEEDMNRGLLATPAIWTNEPDMWLINGKAASNKSDDLTRQDDGEVAVINVEPGKKYRFRFIAASALSLALLAFEQHDRLDIIQADGEYTMPYPVDMIQIASGQRLDALLATKTCEELKAGGKLDFYVQLEGRERMYPVTNYAILRYKDTCGFPDMTRLSTTKIPRRPLHLPATRTDFLDYHLEPLSNNGEKFPTAAEVTRRVILSIQQPLNHHPVWTINNHSWSEEPKHSLPHTQPNEPYLVSLYRNHTAYLPDYDAAVAHGGLDPRTKTYPARMGEVVEVVLQYLNARILEPIPLGQSRFPLIPQTHPMHAHGAHYWDVGGGQGAWDAATAERRLAGTRPVRRDTTVLYGYGRELPAGAPVGWRVWRMRITQPGVWMVHCHTSGHMIGGMQTVWVHGGAEDLLTVPRPDVDGYLTYGGDAYGNESHTPRVLHFHEVDQRRDAFVGVGVNQ